MSMMTIGVVVLCIGLFWTAFKGCVVWGVAHDLFNGGGVPTLDFVIICPIPIAYGGNVVLREMGVQVFPGFGFATYFVLAMLLGFLHWLFDRLGAPERERQSQQIGKQQAGTNETNT